MSESNGQRNVVVGGTNLGTLLFVVFLILKLTGVITWSWWWVTVPLWGGVAAFLAIALFIGLVAFIMWLFSR